MATATSLQRLARRALLQTAKADPALTALLPVTSIAPHGEPAWPHIQLGSPRASRLRASCVQGATVALDAHVFARAREVNGQEVETAYDHASRIGEALEAAWADRGLILEDGERCRVRLSDINLLPDAEPGAWHWFAQVNCRIIAA